MLSVGLTGSIASGKSLAARFFEKCGAKLIDADSISREVVDPEQEGWKRIVENFGQEILKKNGGIDRVKLGEIVFSNAKKRQLLNSLLHPLILNKIKEELKKTALKSFFTIVIVEVPLLIECNLQKDFNKIVVVYADRQTQKKRLMRRDDIDEKEAENRLDSQIDLKEKKKYADYIVDNTGTVEDLEKQVHRVYGFLNQDLIEHEKKSKKI